MCMNPQRIFYCVSIPALITYDFHILDNRLRMYLMKKVGPTYMLWSASNPLPLCPCYLLYYSFEPVGFMLINLHKRYITLVIYKHCWNMHEHISLLLQTWVRYSDLPTTTFWAKFTMLDWSLLRYYGHAKMTTLSKKKNQGWYSLNTLFWTRERESPATASKG